MKSISVTSYLKDYNNIITIDVRSPAEFERGHIPRSINLPLFSDEERALVGICYKNEGQAPAILLGLEIIGPKMANYVREAINISTQKKVVLYCWRGGKRSSSIAWLLQLNGFDVSVIFGGYKAYRQFILHELSTVVLSLRVIGGKTGSGKSNVLKTLKIKHQQQILDLEALANHKGSAFGSLGQTQQPTVEHFENLLYTEIQYLDCTKPIWIENESRKIGKVVVPDNFWEQKIKAPIYNIVIPFNVRLENLVQEYGIHPINELFTAFEKIQKHLAGQLNKIKLMLEKNELHAAAEIALKYYDKTYQYSLDNSLASDIILIEHDTINATVIADKIMMRAEIIEENKNPFQIN
ncbi:MAG: tRNA 2-selenouridine(34) synthase MnmH [Saprospiraceae bacterium]|nr:tRNA 2-selenouridine(34) synthase MnmH [Saprospiraceae bacterium]